MKFGSPVYKGLDIDLCFFGNMPSQILFIENETDCSVSFCHLLETHYSSLVNWLFPYLKEDIRPPPPPPRAPTHPLLCGLLALSFIIHSAGVAMAFRNTFENNFFFPLKKDFRCLIFIVLKKKPTEYVLLLSW